MMIPFLSASGMSSHSSKILVELVFLAAKSGGGAFGTRNKNRPLELTLQGYVYTTAKAFGFVQECIRIRRPLT